MENQIKIFNHSQFGEISEIEINNEPMFVGSEIAAVLGYSNPQKAVRDHIDEEDKLSERIVLSGQVRETVLINESGLYSLVLRSQLPNAKQFKNWVTKEVLPSIRKSGGYVASNENDTPEIIMARGLMAAKEAIDRLNRQIESDKPKVLFASAVETSDRSCLVGELAKILNQNGINIGQNRLFDWLRKNHYLCNRGEFYNRPTQTAMDMGLFEIKQTSINKPDGTILVSVTTKVTGKGQIYFVHKFLKSKAA